MKRWLQIMPVVIFALLAAWLFSPVVAYAQDYLFSLPKLTADVTVNADGSASIDYTFVFHNAAGAHVIDFVDVGMPNNRFSMSGIQADVDGNLVSVSSSEYQGNGSGFAVVLGREAIRPGRSGTVHVFIPDAGTWLREDSQSDDYASFVIAPTWFGSQYLEGKTDLTVTIRFPPGLTPQEPRYHEDVPRGFPKEPEKGFDEQGRIYYTWNNPQATADRAYEFGVSFPAQYVPRSAIQSPSLWEVLGIDPDEFFGYACCGGVGLLLAGSAFLANRSANRRKLQYLPPKVAIEGMGIKRGLTAVEAAILLEQPLDKVMTMLLFGLVKKNAATVIKKDPLEIQATDPLPEGLYEYEKDFLAAFKEPLKERRKALQNMTVDLVKSVAAKMKGFSSKETVAYYKDIQERAWKQVEAAQTPEVKSETFEKYMEWTMLDKDYDDRTRRVFTGPVYTPIWWPRYDPTFRPSVSTSRPATSSSSSGGGGGGISLPTLPGSSFAASMVNGVQNFSSNVIGDLTSFTSGVTNKTNPVPVTTSRGGSGGGGRSCACACACAGCACACAGGGR